MRSPLAYVSALIAIAIVLPGVPDALAVPLSDQLVISVNDRTYSVVGTLLMIVWPPAHPFFVR